MVGGKLSSFVPLVIYFIYSLDKVLSFILSPHKIRMQQAKQPWSSYLTAYSLNFSQQQMIVMDVVLFSEGTAWWSPPGSIYSQVLKKRKNWDF